MSSLAQSEELTKLDEVNEPGPADGRARVRRYGVAWLAAAVVVGLLLGYLAGLLTPTLTRPGDNSPEAGFARDMATHHAQAVEMSILAHEKATDERLRVLAVDIALTQQAQIGMMQRWLREWNLDPTGSQPRMAWMPGGAESIKDGLMPGMATPEQMEQLRNTNGREFDVLFLKLMLDHHIGGIHMADEVLKRSDDAEVRLLANSMLIGQRKEVTVIRDLLAEFGAA